MLKWTYDLVALASGGRLRYNIDWEDRMRALAQAMSLHDLLRFYRELCGLKAIAEHPLNARLFFDDLFAAYKAIG